MISPQHPNISYTGRVASIVPNFLTLIPLLRLVVVLPKASFRLLRLLSCMMIPIPSPSDYLGVVYIDHVIGYS